MTQLSTQDLSKGISTFLSILGQRVRHVGAAATAIVASLAAQAPCYEGNLGTCLGFGDETVFSAVPLGFTFNHAGTPYTAIEVGTNGFVWLGANGNTNPRFNPAGITGSQFVTDPPSIAILLTDLTCFRSPNQPASAHPEHGAIWFNALPGRAVITWKDVQEFDGSGTQFTLQMQILANGEVTFWYSPGTSVVGNQFFVNNTIAGISPGNNSFNPGSTDLSASLPLLTGSEPSVYEEWSPGTFDLAQRTIDLLSTGTGWFVTDRSFCAWSPSGFTPYGTGCPAPGAGAGPEFYEMFADGATFDLSNTAIDLIPTGSGYTVAPSSATFFTPSNATNLGDDTMRPTLLPFAFPTPTGISDRIGVCSNGFVELAGQSFPDFLPNPATLLSADSHICPLWTDLDQTSGGQTYFDVMNPTSVALTWQGVPQFGNTTPDVTFQMQIHSSGRISIVYQTINVTGQGILVGYSRGHGVADPGNTDLSGSMPFTRGVNPAPLVLSSSTGPVIGAPFPMRLTQQPSTASAALLFIGFTQTSNPLDGLGMTACTQYTSLDLEWFFVTTPGMTNMVVGVPANAALLGLSVFAQSAVLAPGVNQFGVAASNGAQLTIGNF